MFFQSANEHLSFSVAVQGNAQDGGNVKWKQRMVYINAQMRGEVFLSGGSADDDPSLFLQLRSK